MIRAALAVFLLASVPLAARPAASAEPESKPKVRAITGFVRLDRDKWEQQVTDTLTVLRKVKAEFESRGYENEACELRRSHLRS